MRLQPPCEAAGPCPEGLQTWAVISVPARSPRTCREVQPAPCQQRGREPRGGPEQDPPAHLPREFAGGALPRTPPNSTKRCSSEQGVSRLSRGLFNRCTPPRVCVHMCTQTLCVRRHVDMHMCMHTGTRMCTCVCTDTGTRMCVHAWRHAHARARTHRCMGITQTHMHGKIHAHTQTCGCTHVHEHVRKYVHAHAQRHAWMNVHRYAHIHARTSRHSHTHRHPILHTTCPGARAAPATPHVPREAVPRARLHRCIVGSSSKKPRWALPRTKPAWGCGTPTAQLQQTPTPGGWGCQGGLHCCDGTSWWYGHRDSPDTLCPSWLDSVSCRPDPEWVQRATVPCP